MRQFMIAAAALTVCAALLAPAQADTINGAPIRNGNQCFKYSASYERDARFGSWNACPQTASVAVTPRLARRHLSPSH